jgi:galactokinase
MRHFHAPGRVNLIGDHIDYMGGTVLPMAIDRGTTVFAAPRDDGRIVGFSDNFPDLGEIVADVSADRPNPEWEWVNFVVAVAFALRRRGVEVPGLDVRVHGDIPNGAGLSSSASVELAVAVTFDALAGTGLSPTELALVGQEAENDFIGVACGIMDQLSIAEGRRGHALAIDCGRLQVKAVPFPEDIAVVVANTNRRRELAESNYNERRRACEEAEQLVGGRLVDVPAGDAESVVAALPEPLRAPARHVITEQARVFEFADIMRYPDLTGMGRLMRESHESLRDDFEVSGPFLDAMVTAAWSAPGVIGARMTGAGFGGCTVNLVEPDAVEEFIAYVGPRYTAAMGREPTFYRVRSADGAREVRE